MDDQDVPDEEMLQQTQEAGSGTQPTSQPEPDPYKDYWAYLSPCLSQTIKRVWLHRSQQVVTVGRHKDNNVVFEGFKISNRHAIIRWNGLENASAIVTIEDMSSNGTFIDGEKIGKGQQRLLKDGNEVAFGVSTRSTENDGLYDYRFMFRDLVSNVKKRRLEQMYDLHNELGKGSFATVYKALHRATGDWVAVKVIHETKRQNGPSGAATASDATRTRSTREIDVMSSLRHPNICALREVFWNTNGSMDLVLELVEGGDLLDFILTRNGLTEDLAKHITYQMCQALAYIHEKGIAHRDLKPENVLLTKDVPPIVKVADFGLAKIVNEQTRLKTMCGTPSYLAPEVVTQQNNSGYDSLVDSWSVGVILFSMCTNTTPFIEPSVEDLKTRIAERQIEWSQLESLGLSREAVDFVRRLLEYNPRDRMKLSDALEHPWLQGYVFAHPIEYPQVSRTGSTKSSLSEDASMRTAASFTGETEAVSQGFEHMKLNGSTNSAFVPGFAPTEGKEVGAGRLYGSQTPPGLTQHKKGELRRRADVLQEAVETDQPLVEPSQEMIEYVQSQESDLYRPASQPNATASGSGSGLPTPTNGKGPNKRVHSELTPLSEDMEDNAGSRPSEASSPLSSVDDLPVVESEPLRKKGRSAKDTETPSKAARSTVKATTTATARKVKAKPDSADAKQTPVATRRSTRKR
ncbi:Pkinase-domain-containing protein [Mycena sanguinolenta]|uniref:Pkinase-domain-containing protein n=1 Tax=Mycena sanguinolenta TaxID=230812 RepID=A0A8H7DIG8_9AGAR|nr:Pkinase-domain-containing protein [Mycena sanguinolenta]